MRRSRRVVLTPLWAFRLLPTLLLGAFLGFVNAPAVAAQESVGDTADSADDAEAGEVSVPQTFDWHLERSNPATTPWGQAIDTAATRLMLSWTTDSEFTNPLVDHLPTAEGVVTPVEHFGYPFGRPGILHTTGELYAWYEALAASSPRVRFEYLDETEEGRRFALVQVGSEANLARLEEIRESYHRLTDPRETPEEEVGSIIADLPAIYIVFAGLHSPETGQPEVAAELTYRVAVSDDPLIREIRENAILFVVPVTEPDGRDRVVEWYRLHRQGEVLDREDRIPGPPFWGKYIRHDNNRDGLQLTLALSRQAVKLYEHWKYPVALDLHESVPFLYVSTGTGPYNPNIDAITRHEWQWIAHHEVTQLTAHGMPGVWTHDFFDGWNPGYMIFALNNRNGNGRFYETFGNSVPATQERTVNGSQTSEEWFRANPPYREVTWSVRNSINYAQSGVLHSLHLVARNRTEVLRNYWRKNQNAVERGRTEAPHAWVVPADQLRKADVAHMLNLLRLQGVELHRMADDVTLAQDEEEEEEDGIEIKAGDFAIRADQPYGNFVRNLMEPQDFPEDAPRPYDDVAWTFPLLYNVEVVEIDDAELLEAEMTEVAEPVHLPGRVQDLSGWRADVDWWVVRYEASAHGLQARWELGAERPVFVASEEVPFADDESFSAGAWLLSAEAFLADEVEAWAGRWGLEVAGVRESAVAEIARDRQILPRIALLHSWRNTQDGGSVRYTFDTMGIPYTYLPEDRLREGSLRDRFDVILFPDQGRNARGRQIFEGLDPEDGPIPWENHPEYPSLGLYSSTPDMTGGMGYEGLAALSEFVASGGTLITAGSATTLPVDFGMVRDVSIRSTNELFSPGSIVRAQAERPEHPLLWGYDEEFPVFDRFGPYLSVSDDREDDVVLQFAPSDRLFLSGLVAGKDELGEEPAVVSTALGGGTIVLFGIRVLHRNQTRGSFGLAWNALLNWDRLNVDPPAEESVAEDADDTDDR